MYFQVNNKARVHFDLCVPYCVINNSKYLYGLFTYLGIVNNLNVKQSYILKNAFEPNFSFWEVLQLLSHIER